MDVSLHQLIRDVMTTGDVTGESSHTHHSFYGPRQRLSLKTSDYSAFWTQFCEIVSNDQTKHREGRKFSLAEVPTNLAPVLAICTLRFRATDASFHDPYNDDFLLGVVYCYQQAINDVLIISERRTELVCCVLEADIDYVENDDIIVQFKLQFPYCRTEASVQKRLIRPAVLQYLRQMNLFSRMNEQPINDWEVIIDPMTPSDPWPL